MATVSSSLEATLSTLANSDESRVPYMFSVCRALASARGGSDKWTEDIEQVLQLMVKPGDMHAIQRCHLAVVVLMKPEHASRAVEWVLEKVQASDDVNIFNQGHGSGDARGVRSRKGRGLGCGQRRGRG